MLHPYVGTRSPGVLFFFTVCTIPIQIFAHGMQQLDLGVCANFIVTDPLTGVFTSPRYPLKYPPNTECVKVVHSPSPNYNIRLDFREIFDIEEEYGELEGCNDVRQNLSRKTILQSNFHFLKVSRNTRRSLWFQVKQYFLITNLQKSKSM